MRINLHLALAEPISSNEDEAQLLDEPQGYTAGFQENGAHRSVPFNRSSPNSLGSWFVGLGSQLPMSERSERGAVVMSCN